MVREDVLEAISEMGAKRYKRGKDWKGYAVYIPLYTGNPVIGLPLVVLEKDNEVRISTDDEALEYLAYTQTPTVDEQEDAKDEARGVFEE